MGEVFVGWGGVGFEAGYGFAPLWWELEFLWIWGLKSYGYCGIMEKI